MTIISRPLSPEAVQMYKIVDDPFKLAEVTAALEVVVGVVVGMVVVVVVVVVVVIILV
jgi:hypothetical protein